MARRADPRGHVRRARRPGGAGNRGTQLRWYGSPFNSGYGSAGQLYSVASIWPNLQRYPVWLVQSHSPLSLLFLLPLVMWKRLDADWTGVRLAYLLIGATWLSYLPYFAFEEWWYLRFMLPSIPAMLVLIASR